MTDFVHRLELIEAGSPEAERLCTDVLAPRSNIPFNGDTFKATEWSSRVHSLDEVDHSDDTEVVTTFTASKEGIDPRTEDYVIDYAVGLTFTRELRVGEFWPGPPTLGEDAFEITPTTTEAELEEIVQNALRNTHYVTEAWTLAIDDATHTPRKTIDLTYSNGLDEIFEAKKPEIPDEEYDELKLCFDSLTPSFDHRDIKLIEAVCNANYSVILDVITDEGGWGGDEGDSDG